MPEDQKPTANKPIKNYAVESREVLGIAFELGYIIALPIVIFGFAGKWLDTKMHTHFYVLIGIALAIFLTSFWMYKRISKIMNDLQEAALEKEQQQKGQK